MFLGGKRCKSKLVPQTYTSTTCAHATRQEILFIREVLNTYIAEYSDQPKDKIEEDCDRDFFMTAEEAVDYGIIDEVVNTKTSHISKPAMPEL